MAEKRLLILGKNGGGTGTQVQSDWAETNTESVSYIKNKPNISDAEIVIKQNNVTKGSFTLNQNGPATINLEGGGGGGSTQVQSDWAETNTESVSYIKNKPNISDAEIVIKQNNVTKGSFTLNQNGPATINLEGGGGGGSTQVQSDWAETNTEAVSYIKNKPTLSIVATSGNYDDLLNKPTIPDAQVNSDWNASSGISQILNKPEMTTQTLTFVDENNVETNVVVYTQPTV